MLRRLESIFGRSERRGAVGEALAANSLGDTYVKNLAIMFAYFQSLFLRYFFYNFHLMFPSNTLTLTPALFKRREAISASNGDGIGSTGRSFVEIPLC